MQYSIGLFDCNENKTQDVIQLLKGLTEKYVPMKDGEIAEEVFFGGSTFYQFFFIYNNIQHQLVYI